MINEELLSKFDFENNDLFSNFIDPDAIIVLLSNSLSNSDWFLLNLLSFSKCVDSEVIFYLDWLEKSAYSGVHKEISHEKVSKAKRNAKLIKELIKCESFDSFIEKIKSFSVYNSSYSDIYSSCFKELNEFNKANSFDY